MDSLNTSTRLYIAQGAVSYQRLLDSRPFEDQA